MAHISLVSAVHSAWADHAKALGSVSLWEAPPHLAPIESQARALDAQLAARIQPHLDQYVDGLISAAEFSDQ